MSTSICTAVSHSLSAREGLTGLHVTQMWRVETGALRIDSAQGGKASRFMRLPPCTGWHTALTHLKPGLLLMPQAFY